MIAKRFIPIFDGTDKRVVGAKDNGKIISFMDMFDLLNDLSDENEQLKEQLEICKDARQAYKQDWKACVSYCDTYKDEIHTLKDNIQGLIEENKMLKNNVEKLSEDVRFLAKLDDYNYKKTYTQEHLE